ncbi:hypothetical protein BOW53_00915 [Solemya pervernicosa gill symbiont]|uniref:Glycosyl transferase n=2 Tax=Gammaproteobacteria incertae sedis TaxID=118884 RepID=A0A1T2LAZ1_9GAMM|nr:ATP-grasp fold amidoligase family protein [Candidatus Reidiella endopervernicosa]OOZ42172.1 hypothetical protein BOW53_00915 [Solemya pervernicosa gill symbiont]QKQ27260.1 hypothetical protein HUE57_13935 [Candidatus Reidiella endopervernicosa]
MSRHSPKFSFKNIRLRLKALLIPDSLYLKHQYKKTFSKVAQLNPPETINEFILQRKLYDRNPRYTECSDKYRVRSWVEKVAGEDCLVPLLAVSDDVDEINYASLPEPFVIKVNHGCGQNMIVREKSEVDWLSAKRQLKGWMRNSHYLNTREWQYKNIQPMVVVEALLSEGGELPKDYKLHCFNGVVRYIAVVHDREHKASVSFYDPQWNYLFIEWGRYEMGPKEKRPETLDEMVGLAQKLSQEFDYVRVDLYSVAGQVYFGELTFTPLNGLSKFNPEKYDRIFAQALESSGSSV